MSISPTTDPVRIALVLISHTNNGKTTLARTLLGADVGEVRDAAHVTQQAEPHLLLRTEAGDSLVLWDTPGFGDSVRLARRMAMSGNPLGWFLSEVWDRWRDRPFWLSQQALRAARDAADVVLYLVNAAEDPRDAGYLEPEMQLLAWLGKPALVLLNQTGPPSSATQLRDEEARWAEHLRSHPVVRQVLALDAFTRSWIHERAFHHALARCLPEAKRAGHARLLDLWEARNQARFEDAMRIGAAAIAVATRDEQVLAPRDPSLIKTVFNWLRGGETTDARQAQAMDALLARLHTRLHDSTTRQLTLYQIAASEAGRINARVAEYFQVTAPVDRAQAGLLGAIVSGVATGVTVDVASGGLSAGAGALVGGLVGVLTFAGAAWGFNALEGRREAVVRFSTPFLQSLVATAVLRYLAIAHFGCGRGRFEEDEAPAYWQAAVSGVLSAHDAELQALWPELRVPAGTSGDDTERQAADARLTLLLTTLTTEVLRALYPDDMDTPD